MKFFNSIKGNAQNKKRARSWIESDLSEWGFTRGEPITITFDDKMITVVLDPNGKRKVAGRTKPNGQQIAILDICYPLEKRLEMFGEHPPKLQVFIEHGKIIIGAL